ncbi:MAG TPA: hypothetical protein PLF63_06240, partial [Rubrivivax sp.]|nr:hypothetical protein [Rubrivivax sp.]
APDFTALGIEQPQLLTDGLQLPAAVGAAQAELGHGSGSPGRGRLQGSEGEAEATKGQGVEELTAVHGEGRGMLSTRKRHGFALAQGCSFRSAGVGENPNQFNFVKRAQVYAARQQKAKRPRRR